MGRKKKNVDETPVPAKEPPRKDERDDSSDSDESEEPIRYDIDPEIQELACAFGIETPLCQRLNDIMIGKRSKSWEQDLEKLHELLKEAHSPTALLQIKMRDMEKGTFIGKTKCGPQVKQLSQKHRLDKNAGQKLEEAMAMREAMGKDVEKDIKMLDEHLQASNAPSKLISMKLESLRKGFPVGHCIYAREPAIGVQGPGVDGVFDKREKRSLGYSDKDLEKRFSDKLGSGGGQLMDEATVRRLMAAERQQRDGETQKSSKKRKRDSSRSESPKQKRKAEAEAQSGSPKRKRKRSRSTSRRNGKRRSRSSSRRNGKKRK